MRRGIVVLVGVVCAAFGLAAPARAAPAKRPVVKNAPYEAYGYIPMSDGVKLRYDVMRPSRLGRFPTALIYSPYGDGSGPLNNVAGDPPLARLLLDHGYAVVGVNMRGSGCSDGTFDLLSPQEGADGAAAVEWAAAQPWSTGHVGMFGDSFPGISQLGVVAHAPPHLDAIAPWHVVTDLYRDAAVPGGIFNVTFASLAGLALFPGFSAGSAAFGVAQGDAGCVATPPRDQLRNAPRNPTVGALEHAYDDAFYAERRLGDGLANVRVPVLGCGAWQDDDITSHGSWGLASILNPATTWSMWTNGFHDICLDAPMSRYLIPFLDRYVKGVQNGFEQTPHVIVLHDEHESATAPELPNNATAAQSHPAWVTTHARWPVAVNATHLWLGSNGRLESSKTDAGSDSYVYPGPSSSTEDGAVAGQPNAGWKEPDGPGGALSYTTPRLTQDAEFFGPGSVNLWLKSTARDTDLQVTLSEVRPDGQEVYVERGWLRASHRKLDESRSTALRPFQTHQRRDARALTPGQATLLRVEVFPFDYVFRAGSAIRLTIDAPAGLTGLLGHLFQAKPAINTILHTPTHQSELVLGLVPGARSEKGYPACNTIINQPCRRNLTPVPAGRLSL